MIPRIITVHDNKVVIDESILSVPELKAVWEEYKDTLPLQYLWALYDPESPYQNYSESEREEYILQDFPMLGWNKNDDVMIQARERCDSLYNTPLRKILKGAKSAVEKFAEYFETTEIEHGRDGNVTAIKQALVDLPKMIKGYLEAESAYKQELQRTRGGFKEAIDEDAPDNWEE